MTDQQEKFKPTVTLGQLIASSITVLGCCIYFYGATQARLSVLEAKQQATENSNTDVKIQMDRLSLKIDKVVDGIGSLAVSVQEALDINKK